MATSTTTFILAVIFVASASTAPAAAAAFSKFELNALLLGSNGVGTGDPKAFGSASLEFSQIGKNLVRVDYKIIVQGLSGKLPPKVQHIHIGAAGTNGNVVVVFPGVWQTLSAPKTIALYGTLTDVATLKAFTPIIAKPQGFYVNVHTESYPAGAVRGQLF